MQSAKWPNLLFFRVVLAQAGPLRQVRIEAVEQSDLFVNGEPAVWVSPFAREAPAFRAILAHFAVFALWLATPAVF